MGRKARNKTRIRPPLESGSGGDDAMDTSTEVDFEQMLETSVITRSGLRLTPGKSSLEVVRENGTSPLNKEIETPKRTGPALRSPAATRATRDDSMDKKSPLDKVNVKSPMAQGVVSTTLDNKDVNGNDTSSLEQNDTDIKTYRTPLHARVRRTEVTTPVSNFGTPRRLRTFTSSPLQTRLIPPKSSKSAPSTPVQVEKPPTANDHNSELTPADVEERLKSPERSRYLLKQLESSLSPKFTQPAKTSSVHVSRYGRIQKQKENSDYIPLDVAKFITKSPPKPKANPAAAATPVKVEDEEEEVIQIIKTDVEGEPDIVPIDQIQIVDLDVSLSESLVAAAAVEPVEEGGGDPVNVEMEKSSDADSARGSSIDLDTVGSSGVTYKVGQVFWGAFHAKSIHWPCMIYPNPEDDQLVLTKKSKCVVHVVFFADNGRRGWIPESTLLPFCGLEEYKTMIAAKFKPLKNKLTAHLKRQTWIDAIRQAEDVQFFPVETREARFQELLEAELAAKLKIPMRKRAMSISAGYHSNSLDESFESREKRLRSPTPESPMYEALPVKNKRIKLEASADDVISRYFQSMKDGSLESTSATGSECSDDVLSAAELAGLDRDEYNSYLLGMNRSYDAIMLAQAGRARTSHRLRTQALRNSFLKLESLTKKEETSPVRRSTSPTVPRTKKPQSLDEMFCFKLEKNYLMKGIPKGFACAVCLEPSDVVKCSACHNHFHPRCTGAKASSDPKNFKCLECADGQTHRCFVCNDQDATTSGEPKHRCALSGCGKYYHIYCLRLFPQHKITSTPNSSTLFCPYHTCHTCVSDDPRANATATRGSLIRCIRCPSSYHPDAKCVPAGSQLFTTSTMICPKHSLEQCSINVNWCFLCCKGGSLICCETCPTAFHLECLQFIPPEGRYICEECESGRMPLYNEIVWAKYSVFKFWPALIIPPPAIPDVVFRRQHEQTDICVRFFGTHDFGWINRRRIYLYHEGDSDSVTDRKRSGMMERYNEALREARQVFERLQAEKARAQESATDDLSFKPPMYVKIKSNKYIAPLKARSAARDDEEDSICECKPTDTDPCGLDTNCINRALLVECNPKTCPAGEACQNQCFERKQYPALMAKRIPNKGWGLVAQEDIHQGQFVIEYVGEVINSEELARRIKQKQEQKDENYYFLTVDSELTIDAGPKGNLARFINHSCEPNCETLLWKVGGSQSVGLFALKDLKAGEELTFNYNFETFGDQKKICHCGASKCSGFIGQKYRPPAPEEAPASGKGGKQGKKAGGMKRRRNSLHPSALSGDKKRKLNTEPETKTAPDVKPTPAAGSGKMRRIKQQRNNSSPVEEPVVVKEEPVSPTQQEA